MEVVDKKVAVPTFPIGTIRLTAKGDVAVTPAIPPTDYGRKVAQLICAFELGESLTALQTIVNSYANKNPYGSGRRLTLLVDPLLPGRLYLRDNKAFVSQEVLNAELIDSGKVPAPSNRNESTLDLFSPQLLPKGADGANAVVEVLEETLGSLMYGPASDSSETFSGNAFGHKPCYLMAYPESLVHSNMPNNELRGSFKELIAKRQDIDEKIGALRQTMFVTSELKSVSAEEETKRSTFLADTARAIDDLQETAQQMESDLNATIGRIYTESLYEKPGRFMAASGYSWFNDRLNQRRPLSEDSIMKAAIKLNQPLLPLSIVGAACTEDMVVIRLIYFGDQSLDDLLAPPALATKEDMEAYYQKLDTYTFAERLAEGHRKSLAYYRKHYNELSLAKGGNPEDAKLIPPPADVAPTVVQFIIPSLVLGEFFEGIHELRTSHFVDRARTLHKINTQQSRRPSSSD